MSQRVGRIIFTFVKKRGLGSLQDRGLGSFPDTTEGLRMEAELKPSCPHGLELR